MSVWAPLSLAMQSGGGARLPLRMEGSSHAARRRTSPAVTSQRTSGQRYGREVAAVVGRMLTIAMAHGGVARAANTEAAEAALSALRWRLPPHETGGSR